MLIIENVMHFHEDCVQRSYLKDRAIHFFSKLMQSYIWESANEIGCGLDWIVAMAMPQILLS